MDLLKNTDYSSWYTRLNEIRSKHGVAQIPTYSVSQNSPALSSQMQTVQSSITTVKTTTDKHLTDATIDTTVPNIAQGNSVLLSTKSKIDGILTEMYNVCHHNVDYSQYGDDDPVHEGSDHSGEWSYDAVEYGGYKCGIFPTTEENEFKVHHIVHKRNM